MKNTELRIGNFINGEVDEGIFNEVEVVALDSVDITEYSIWAAGLEKQADHYYSFEPIPLTEEWLVKFSWKKINGWDDYEAYIKDEVEITFNEEVMFKNSIGKEIKYVHTLQNLYFALTGKELVCSNSIID